MRIALVVHDARPGGGQDRYALELANGLSRRHEVTLVARSAQGYGCEVRFVKIAAPRRPFVLLARVFARNARRILGRMRWDIVHTVGGALPGASVVTAQYCHQAWGEVERRWPSQLVGRMERTYRAVETMFAQRDEWRAARHANLRALIGVSKRTLREWQQAYAPTANVQTVVPNGVDLERFKPATPEQKAEFKTSLRIRPSARVILLVGALLRKGVETALDVLPHMPDDVYLVALGAGPHERLDAVAARLGVHERVRLVNPVPDVERYLAGSDLLLFPTKYEPFGMVVAEAWAAGLPVVMGGRTGAAEWATEGENSIIVADPTDVRGFVEAATRVLADQQLAEQMRNGGRALAARFAWERIVSETEAVYQRAEAN